MQPAYRNGQAGSLPQGSKKCTLASTTFAPPESQIAYRGLQKAIKRISNHFREDLTFESIRRESGMSKATFERHFKRHTGKSFTRFLAAVRLNAACRSLLETDLPVSEVALACGYGNLSYFHRRFRSLYNRSPLAFRREIRKENTKIPPRSGI